jgi:metal-responsive CopG/Arc/MetJ family transcriptional regulator
MKTVTVPFQEDLLRQVDKFATDSTRSRADIIADATRMFVERQQKWQTLFSHGDGLASKSSLAEADVMNETKAWRSNEAGGRY